MKVAQLQMTVTDDKAANIQRFQDVCRKIQSENVDVVCLPEMFSCPYETTMFPKYAETGEGQTWTAMSEMAAESHQYIIGGSIPELDSGRYYNTCYVFDREGKQIGKHRKMHLFDIDVKGGQQFKESDILSSGNEITVIDTEFGKIGVIICYDIRFPELTRLMGLAGAETIFVPAAFNMTTGPAHWELTFRARALDNQLYFFGTAAAQNPQAGYKSYGHSIMVSPWGEVIEQLGLEEGLMINDTDPDYLKDIRDQLPLLKHRRQDIYDLSLSAAYSRDTI
jgi:omega-amidase